MPGAAHRFLLRRKQGWLAEHMLILGANRRKGKTLRCGCFQRVRQNEFRNVDSAEAFRRLEITTWRRLCLDAILRRRFWAVTRKRYSGSAGYAKIEPTR